MTIRETGLDEVIAMLGRMNSVILEEASGVMDKSMSVFTQLVSNETPVNNDDLRASIGKQVSRSGNSLSGEVSTPLAYGAPVETGRKPGRPPPTDAIKAWVVRKGIASGKNADSAAYLIARAIGRRGTKGAFMFKKGFEAGKPIVLKLWDDLPSRVVARLS